MIKRGCAAGVLRQESYSYKDFSTVASIYEGKKIRVKNYTQSFSALTNSINKHQ